MAVKITKRVVDGLKVDDGRTLLFDTEIPGFGVRATSRGKMFFVQYRAGTGRSAPKRRVSLGRYGPITVDQARHLAREALGTVAHGGDPAVERDAAKEAPTVAQLGADYLADVRDRRKPGTAVEYARMWKRHVVPALGTRRTADVTPADVARLHRSMRKTPYGANRVLALLGSFFAFAELHGVRPKHTNPAHEIEPFKEESRERFLTPEEVVRLGDALNTALHPGLPPAPTRRKKRKTGPTAKHRPKSADKPVPANPFAVAAIRFLVLSGWREREVLTLRWSDLDVDRRRTTLPDTKTGKSKRLLGAPAWLLLSELPRADGSPYVFPGRTPDRPLVEISRVWYAVRTAAKLADVRLHDLRHSFASVGASMGGSLLVIGKLLGHRDHATTAKYAHLLEDPVQAAADATSEQIAKWLDGSGRDASGVVGMVARRRRP